MNKENDRARAVSLNLFLVEKPIEIISKLPFSEKWKNSQFSVEYFILETRLVVADLDLIHPKLDFN